MPDVTPDVHAQATVEAPPVVAEAAAGEPEPLAQRRARHPFDAAQHAGEPVHVLGLRGREREAAVAGDDRRRPVPRRRCGERIPVELNVVVRVHVDESRRHRETIGIEDAARAAR